MLNLHKRTLNDQDETQQTKRLLCFLDYLYLETDEKFSLHVFIVFLIFILDNYGRMQIGETWSKLVSATHFNKKVFKFFLFAPTTPIKSQTKTKMVLVEEKNKVSID